MEESLNPDQEGLVNGAQRRPETTSDLDRQQAIDRLRTFGQRHGLSLGEGLTVKKLVNEGRR